MPKIKLDGDRLKGIIPELESISTNLTRISYMFNSSYTPYFNKKTEFNRMQTDINQYASKINRIVDKINRIDRMLDEVIVQYSNEAKTLPNYIIEKRDSIIKL